MYWSKPCVATDVGDCNLIIDNNVTGYIVESENPKALSKGIAKIIELKNSDFTVMGKKARVKLESKFTIKHYSNNVLSTYNKLFSKGI